MTYEYYQELLNNSLWGIGQFVQSVGWLRVISWGSIVILIGAFIFFFHITDEFYDLKSHHIKKYILFSLIFVIIALNGFVSLLTIRSINNNTREYIIRDFEVLYEFEIDELVYQYEDCVCEDEENACGGRRKLTRFAHFRFYYKEDYYIYETFSNHLNREANFRITINNHGRATNFYVENAIVDNYILQVRRGYYTFGDVRLNFLIRNENITHNAVLIRPMKYADVRN